MSIKRDFIKQYSTIFQRVKELQLTLRGKKIKMKIWIRDKKLIFFLIPLLVEDFIYSKNERKILKADPFLQKARQLIPHGQDEQQKIDPVNAMKSFLNNKPIIKYTKIILPT